MSRNVSIVILCEDRQHAAFVRRFLESTGKGARVQRVVISPAGRGSGEQFVRLKDAEELTYYSSRKHRVEQALIVIIDADKRTLADRIEQIESGCDQGSKERRHPDERVAIFVPARNIETWLAYLDGQQVDEGRDQPYPKLDRERDCQRHVDVLFEMCQRGKLRPPAPASLEAACTEYQRRVASK